MKVVVTGGAGFIGSHLSERLLDGTTRRDYTYVDDVVNGIVRAIERPKGFQIYNLGIEQTVVLRDLIKIIERALKKRAVISFQSIQTGDIGVSHTKYQHVW
jgi:UDP-glucuronate 4-epimerase